MPDKPADPSSRKLVRDLMTVGVTTCAKSALVVAVARTMAEKKLEAVVVLDEEGHAEGYICQEDIVKVYSRPDVRTLKAEDIMHEGVHQVPPEIPLAAAAQLMLDQGVRALFLMHRAGGIEYPAAVITYNHFIRHLAAQSDEELRDLGIAAERKNPLEVFIERREAARKQNRYPS